MHFPHSIQIAVKNTSNSKMTTLGVKLIARSLVLVDAKRPLGVTD